MANRRNLPGPEVTGPVASMNRTSVFYVMASIAHRNFWQGVTRSGNPKRIAVLQYLLLKQKYHQRTMERQGIYSLLYMSKQICIHMMIWFL